MRKMRVLLAPDKFKGSLTAVEAAEAMARGVRKVRPDAQIDVCPVADGGEGTVEAMLAASRGESIITEVIGPMGIGQSVRARWGMMGLGVGTETIPGVGAEPTAIIEMAAASGLALVPANRRDPCKTTTFGTGQLIAAALDHGATRLIVGIGGSATNDGGCGMAAALGVLFIGRDGGVIDGRDLSGGVMQQVMRIDSSGLDPRMARVRIIAACDVTNPMTGPQGAAHVYGPQKGATPAQVEHLDAGLVHLAQLMRRDLSRDVERQPGAGAAGGLGGGLMAFLGARLQPGIDLVLDVIGFAKRAEVADVVFTGEGRMDASTASGKACMGVARSAAAQGKPTIALVGAIDDDDRRTLARDFQAIHVIGEGRSHQESILHAAALVEQAAERAITGFPA